MEKQVKILVVDGSRVLRRVMQAALVRHLGSDRLRIYVAGTAAEAQARLDHERFDLITSALQLPDMHGIDLCRQLRRTPANRFTPFVVVTAEPHERHMREGYSAGVTDYFDKTRGVQEFTNFVRGLVDRYAALSGRILYIEDNDLDAAFLTRKMERHGLTVLRVASAEVALKIVDDSFDAVVTDFFLDSELSGGDFLHMLRCGLRFGLEALPVLVITGESNAEIQAEIFRAGGNDFVTKPVTEEVFLSRLRSLLLIRRQFTRLQRQSEEIQRMASQDILTGVYNRRYLIERANQFLAEPRNRPAWAVLIDLDHFKSINDRYGHATGDRVLAATGALFRGCAREGDVIARSGGEEFVLLLRCRSREECMEEIESLRARIEALCPEGLTVTASIGVATGRRADEDFESILEEADRAMYRAKEEGRNRVVMADIMPPRQQKSFL